MIREITPADEALFLRLTREFYHSQAVLHPIPDRHHRATFQELMRSRDYARCYIIEDGGAPVGYGLISLTFSQEAGGLVVWLEELYLTSDAQGKGLGTEYLTWIQSAVPAARYRLEVEPDNARAKALYRRLGFTPLGYQQMVLDK